MNLRLASWFGLLLGIGLLAQPAPLPAQPAGQLRTLNPQPSTAKVLDLDGKDAYVELPPNLFTNDVVTVEGWVKWRTFGDYSRFFEFSDAAMMVGVLNHGKAPDLTFQRVLTRQYAGQSLSQARGQLALGQWMHLALVAGANFSKLYCNGHLLTTSTSSNTWAQPRCRC